VKGTRTHPQRVRAAIWAVAITAAIALALPAHALASASWNDGPLQESQILNCASIIFGNPYTEAGSGTYVGQYLDQAAPPHIGDLYYVHVVVYGLGNACAGQYADIQLQLPQGTVPYTPSHVTASQYYPVKCYLIHPPDSTHSQSYTTQDTGSACGQDPQSGPNGYVLDPPAGAFGTNSPPFWPIPQGGGVEIQIPVISTKPELAQNLGAVVQLADGNSSPTLNPTALLQVDDLSPEVDYPTGTAGTAGSESPTITSTSAVVQGVVYNFYRAGTIKHQFGGPGGTGATAVYTNTTSGDPIDGSIYGIQDYQGWSGLQPGCTYNWRIEFIPTSGPTVYGSNQTVHTPGTFNGSCGAPSAFTPAGAAPSINFPKPTQGAPPVTPAPVTTNTLPATGTNPTAASGGSAQSGSGGGSAGGGGGGTSAHGPVVAFKALSIPVKQKGASILAKLDVTLLNSQVELDGSVPAAQARKIGAGRALLKVKAKTVVVAKLIKRGVKAGKLTLKVPLNAKGKRALKRHHKLTVSVVLTVTPPGGTPQVVTRKVTLRSK
jgi:hypothetical protein